MLAARRIRVKGRVQGVGFRHFVAEAARVAGVSGWVRNLADGSVEALLEGESEAVRQVERRVGQGPPASRVESVSAVAETVSDRPAGFHIRG